VSKLISWLGGWVRLVTDHAWLTLICISLVTGIAALISIDRFKIDSELKNLIHQDAPWRKDFDDYQSKFPQLVDPVIVVISGESYIAVEDATIAIESEMRSRSDRFMSIYSALSGGFFRDHALLYLARNELFEITDRLAEAQPVLTAVAEDPSLRGVLHLVESGIENGGVERSALDMIIDRLSASAGRLLSGEDARIAWGDEFFQQEGRWYRLIVAQAQRNFDEPLPNAQVMATLREIVGDLAPDGVTVGITGEVALAHEEIEAAITGVALAGWIAVALLLVILVVGVRSLQIIIATFLMLAIGIVWTSAYAMLAVGEYNTLSLVFLVMFFGLGVDFALHFSLRYQEAVNLHEGDRRQALVASTESVGGAILLCTLTTAIGFLGFWPTDYKGLADLGVISAGGMLVAAFLTFTFLPTFYAVSGRIRPHVVDLPSAEQTVGWLIRHRIGVVAVVAAFAGAAVMLAWQAKFDFSVLALKDPDAPSMRTLRELQAEQITNDYSLNVVTSSVPAGTVPHSTEAGALQARVLEDAERLRNLDTVATVTTPWNYLPTEQNDKLEILQELEQLLYSALVPTRRAQPPGGDENRRSILSLADRLVGGDEKIRQFEDRLRSVAELDDQGIGRWQVTVLEELVDELEWLKRAIYVEKVSFGDLPEGLRERVMSADGSYLTVVVPSRDVSEVEALREFIESVRKATPTATGRPVIEWGVGEIVINAFTEALIIALTGIVIVLFLTFRRIRDVVLILVPLVLAALLTLAFSVALGMSLNMANILVLPLIFGLGVDNGIHMVDRFNRAGNVSHLMHSSTPRAVMLSTLTTVGTFSALALSPHQGTASIGELLTIAVMILFALTVFLLPVLLSFSQRSIEESMGSA